MSMSKRCKLVRESLKLSQSQLASKLNTSQTTITLIENEEREPSKSIIISLCKEYKVNINWLITGEGNMYFSKNDFNRKKISYQEMLPLLNKLGELSPDEKEQVNNFIDSMKKK